MASEAPLVGWPFLVSKSKDHGFRTIVAPPAFYKQEGIVRDVATLDNAISPPDEILLREVWGMSQHDEPSPVLFTVIFRAVLATTLDIGGLHDDRLTDETHRPIPYFYGIMAPGRFPGPVDTLPVDLFEKIHRLVIPAYAAFWYERVTLVSYSDPLPISLGSQRSFNVKSLEPFQFSKPLAISLDWEISLPKDVPLLAAIPQPKFWQPEPLQPTVWPSELYAAPQPRKTPDSFVIFFIILFVLCVLLLIPICYLTFFKH